MVQFDRFLNIVQLLFGDAAHFYKFKWLWNEKEVKLFLIAQI